MLQLIKYKSLFCVHDFLINGLSISHFQVSKEPKTKWWKEKKSDQTKVIYRERGKIGVGVNGLVIMNGEKDRDKDEYQLAKNSEFS